MARFLTSLIIGAVVTFLLFLIMALLIKGSGERKANQQERIVIEINTTPPDSDTQVRRPPPPPPPPPPAQPPKAPQPEPDTTSAAGAIGFNMPGLSLGNANAGLGDPSSMMRDGEATPIVRIEPRYPVQAARDGLQGWVKLRFSIMEDGSVDDVEVMDAEPRRVFDREAIRALRRWKYSPKVVDGKPMKQPGMQVQLDFTLDMAGG
ncbi:energy transducer TonB [Rheinheimera salexigens]|uniref:Protein TonB n=1 Tax=Rheinheimera salexigens TaxID=1628148 RepID=A0A1E7Q6R7_9GAMM|nr:energy transducer TonB [Rheinheimera salexigens]OEY69875.1 energy transducer TonB [Rheinheimera salexigens]